MAREPAAIWFEVVPFAVDEQATSWQLDPTWEGAPTWEGGEGQAVVCNAVDDDARTVHCRTQFLQAGQQLESILTPGMIVEGSLMMDRDPVAGARIAVTLANLEARKPFLVPLHFDADDKEPRRHVESDAQGRFALPPLGPGEYRLEVRSPGGRIDILDSFTVSSPEEPQGTEGQAPSQVLDLGEIQLVRGLAVRFTVSSATGELLEEALVSASQPGERQRVVFSASTNQDGEAWIRGVDPALPLRTTCRAEGYLRELQAHNTPPTDIHCFLDPLAKLTGRVTAAGEPVEEATVSFELPSRFAGGLPERVATSVEEDGSFLVSDLEPGTYQLIVAAPGFRVEQRQVQLTSGETLDLAEIELTAAAELWGVVRDAQSGEPIAGAQLLSISPPGAVDTLTDETGEFQVAAESNSEIRIRVLAEGYPAQNFDLPPDPTLVEPPFVIELQTGGWIDVWAFDETSGEPCVGCPVVHDLPGTGPGDLSRGSATTDSEGHVLLGPLVVGQHHVILEEVRSEGSAVVVTSGDNLRTADVRPGETVRVVFGAPTSQVRVRFWPIPQGWQLLVREGTDQQQLPPDNEGSFPIRIGSGPVELRLVRPGTSIYQATLPAGFDQETVELELPTTRVQGRLTGSATLTREVRLISVEQRPSAWTVSDASGTFDVPWLAPGGYHLVVDGTQVAVVALAEGQQLDLGELPLPE